MVNDDYILNDFNKIADEEVSIGTATHPAVINRTSSRYRDLNPLLKKNETLAEIFVLCDDDIKLNDTFTAGGDTFRVLEVRENITHQIKHLLCACKNSGSVMKGVEQ
jgi:hypothetical protein